MSKGIYNVSFTIGDGVYLKTDPEQVMRIVTGINIRMSGVTYCLAYCTSDSWHYEIEITLNRDIVKATSN